MMSWFNRYILLLDLIPYRFCIFCDERYGKILVLYANDGVFRNVTGFMIRPEIIILLNHGFLGFNSNSF